RASGSVAASAPQPELGSGGGVKGLMPLMLRKAELHAPQVGDAEPPDVAFIGLVRRGEHPGDDPVAGPELLTGGLQPGRNGLDHLLQPLWLHRMLLLAVHEDAS